MQGRNVDAVKVSAAGEPAGEATVSGGSAAVPGGSAAGPGGGAPPGHVRGREDRVRAGAPAPAPGAPSVLAIEDDADIRWLLRTVLGREGFGVYEAATGRDGLRCFYQTRPDVVILDIALPDLDGWEVLERIRDMSDAPVLVLTARSAEADKVRGLNAGADDYLTKPFSHVELLARLQAIRRRVPPSPARAAFDDGRVRIDFLRRQAYLHDVPVPLTPIEYRLLSALVRHAGEILSADRLVELAWDETAEPGRTRVKYAVLRLRRKLGWESDEAPLRTVRGFGYRYEPQGDAVWVDGPEP